MDPAEFFFESQQLTCPRSMLVPLTALSACSCANIDAETGIGSCEDVPKAPLPDECSSQLQAIGVCTPEGDCVSAGCDPAKKGADCPAPLEIYSTCATAVCNDGVCGFETATPGTVCVPALPGESTTANGLCNGLLCYGPGQCIGDFENQCGTPSAPCEVFSYAPPLCLV